MAWWKFVIAVICLILYIIGEWLITLLFMLACLPVVAWGYIKAFYEETYHGRS